MKIRTDKARGIVRFAAAFTAVILIATSLAGCSNSKNKPEDKRTVVTINGNDVCYDYFRYVFMTVRDQYADGDLNCFVDDITAQMAVSEETMDVLLRNAAIEAVADKYKVKLTDEDEDTYNRYIEYYKNKFSDESGFYDDLKKSYLTDYSLEKLFKLILLKNRLISSLSSEGGEYYLDDEKMKSEVENSFFCMRYIIIDVSNGESDEYARSRAKEAHERALAGEDFASLIEEFSESTNLGDKSTGYCNYYTSGELVSDAAEEAALALDEGEISDIIEDEDYGYFIIQRMAPDSEYINSHLDDFRKQYTERELENELDKTARGLEVKYTDLFNSINVLTME